MPILPVKLSNAELKVMEALWKGGDLTAGQLAKILKERTGWNRNTTYTVVKKLIAKGAVARSEPNFICRAAITKECVRQSEAEELIDRLFDGSADLFLSAYMSGKGLSEQEIAGLKRLVDELE